MTNQTIFILFAAFVISTSGLVVNFIKRGDAKGAENDGRTLQGETVLIGHFGATYLAYQKRN